MLSVNLIHPLYWKLLLVGHFAGSHFCHWGHPLLQMALTGYEISVKNLIQLIGICPQNSCKWAWAWFKLTSNSVLSSSGCGGPLLMQLWRIFITGATCDAAKPGERESKSAWTWSKKYKIITVLPLQENKLHINKEDKMYLSNILGAMAWMLTREEAKRYISTFLHVQGSNWFSISVKSQVALIDSFDRNIRFNESQLIKNFVVIIDQSLHLIPNIFFALKKQEVQWSRMLGKEKLKSKT